MQSYVSDGFMTGIMNDFAMSTIEDNVATLSDTSSFPAWTESTKHKQKEKNQNMINVQMA